MTMSTVARERPLKAYIVRCIDDDHGAVVEFAERGADVDRRSNCNCDCDYIDRTVRRAPNFDKYSPGPVNPMQCLAEGWNWECSGCGRQVWGDDGAVMIRESVYHSRECVQMDREHWERWVNGDDVHESVRSHVAAIDEWLSAHSETSVDSGT